MNNIGKIDRSRPSINENNLSLPVTVYDTIQKKPVLIFSSNRVLIAYLFDSTDNSKFSVPFYVRRKRINKTNYFKRSLAFRHAKAEHVQMLGDELYVVLDEIYRRTTFKVSLISQMQ